MTNREFFKDRSAAEAAAFGRVFKAVPNDKLDWKPEPKARSPRELIGHLIGHEQDLVELLETNTINHRMQVPFDTIDEAVALFQAANQQVQAKLGGTEDSTWDAVTGKFNFEGNTIMEAPCGMLGWTLLFDSIHHRGQMSTYLRPMGSKVPSIYGPSADDGGH